MSTKFPGDADAAGQETALSLYVLGLVPFAWLPSGPKLELMGNGEGACKSFHVEISGVGLEAHIILLKLSKNLASGHFLSSTVDGKDKRILVGN